MSKTLDAMTQDNWSWGGSAGFARYEFSDDFVDEGGREFGAGPKSYLEVPTTISGSVVTVPAYPNFPTTESAISNNGVTVTCHLLDSNRVKRSILFADCRIYTSLPSVINLSQLVLANGASRLLRDTDVWTKEQVIDYVETRPPAQKMTAAAYGIGRLSVPAVSAADPIAVGDNDPRINFQINVKSYGATGDGVTDDRAAIQAADTAAALIGASVFFPGTDDFYLVSGAVRPSDGAHWHGAGYRSQIKCPAAGWTVVATTNFGIINVDNKDNVRISNMRITGTKSAISITTTPKLIYFEAVTGLMVDHCWFDTTIDEAIWQGGTQTTNVRVFITNNYFADIGYDATAYKDNCAIQLNIEDGVVANNVFYQVGTAIACSGQRLAIAGNQVRDISGVGINIGDGEFVGKIVVAGNSIEFTESTTGNPRKGIRVAGSNSSGNHLVNVTGNTVRATGTAALGTAWCYSVAGTASVTLHSDVQLVGNTAEIQVRGIGFQIAGAGGDGNIVTLASNTIKLSGENGVSYGISVTAGAGLTATVRSSDNRAYGFTRAQGSYAFYYVGISGGTVNAVIQGDITTEGNIALGDSLFTAGELDSTPWYDTSTLTATSGFLRSPRVAMLNLYTGQAREIASGVITLAGTSANTLNRRTQITVDTQGAAASDDLDTINGTQQGDIIILKSFTDGRDVVVKNGTGNIFCGSDFTLATTRDRMFLISDGTNLYQISRSTN